MTKPFNQTIIQSEPSSQWDMDGLVEINIIAVLGVVHQRCPLFNHSRNTSPVARIARFLQFSILREAATPAEQRSNALWINSLFLFTAISLIHIVGSAPPLVGTLFALTEIILAGVFLFGVIKRVVTHPVNRWQRRRTRRFLETNLREDWHKELVAWQIMQDWQSRTNQTPRTLIKAQLWWEVRDIDEPGNRILVAPLFASEHMRGLAGDDPVSEEPFFMAVPPQINSVNQGLSWAYGTAPGFWETREEIYET